MGCPPRSGATAKFHAAVAKEKTFEALLRQLAGLAQQQPVLMVFDDIHWIDPSSRDLLDRLIERVANWSVLLLVLFRPEFQPPWIGQPQVSLMTLARLDRRDTAAMVASVAGDAGPSPEIMAEIAERTDGVPLFIEELTKAVWSLARKERQRCLLCPAPAIGAGDIARFADGAVGSTGADRQGCCTNWRGIRPEFSYHGLVPPSPICR